MNLDHVASECVVVQVVRHRYDPPLSVDHVGAHWRRQALTTEFDHQKMLVRGDESASERLFGRCGGKDDAIGFPTLAT